MTGGRDDHVTGGDETVAAGFDGLAAGLSGLGKRASAFGWADDAGPSPSPSPAAVPGAEHILPGLDQDERLPWLHTDEDDLDAAGVDPRRVWGFVLSGTALLLIIIGGVWWATHHNGGALLADGSTIAAPPGPIKEAPQDPGGKTFDGTGDSSFAVSQGHVPGATLATGGDGADNAARLEAAAPDAAKPDTAKSDAAKSDIDNTDTTAPGAGGGIGVQVGAYSSQLAAENAWARLIKAYDVLAGVSHRVVEGKADIGTVYRLQAVAGNTAAASALCDRLKTSGLTCQVRN